MSCAWGSQSDWDTGPLVGIQATLSSLTCATRAPFSSFTDGSSVVQKHSQESSSWLLRQTVAFRDVGQAWPRLFFTAHLLSARCGLAKVALVSTVHGATCLTPRGHLYCALEILGFLGPASCNRTQPVCPSLPYPKQTMFEAGPGLL